MISLAIASLALTVGQPLPETFEQTIRADMVRRLRDPQSAQYVFPEVRNDALYCFWLNARNGYGGYVGYMPVQVRRTAEGALEYQIASPGNYTVTLYSRECVRAGYSPPS